MSSSGILIACCLLLAISSSASGFTDNEILDEEIHQELLEWKAPEQTELLVMEWGKWDSRTVADKGGQDLKDLEKRNSQIIERIRTGYFEKAQNKHNDSSEVDKLDPEIAVIIDFEGMKLSQMRSVENIKYLMRNFARMERAYNYFSYGFIVNTNPLVDQIINLSKPFMVAEDAGFKGTLLILSKINNN
ncbi:unnamed protein product [Allacma fusca]|uniref:CRAL-TRIO domain-containing protein n=1 Tax=Allacma fusca TaxID=39272 RepID=A0A8J2NUM0_9HEXA|nr:unnamed protein product [Allacma fusca]